MIQTFDGAIMSGVYARTDLSCGLTVSLLLFCIFVLLLSGSTALVEYLFLLLLSVFAMHSLMNSVDYMSLFVSLELQSFCLIVLSVMTAGVQGFSASLEAGLKYFLLSAFSSAITILGISLAYFVLGDFSLDSTIYASSMNADGGIAQLKVAILLVGVGLLWKLSVAPLHQWAADVYQGIPSRLTMFFSTLPKLSVLGFWCGSFDACAPMVIKLSWFVCASLLIGTLSGYGQLNLKRLLAYSSISQMGYILIPLCTHTFDDEQLRIGSGAALLTALYIYIWSSLGVWGLIVWPETTPQFLMHWRNLGQPRLYVAATLSILLMSLAGLPPLAGFLGKITVFESALTNGQYALVCFGVCATALGTFVYVPIIRSLYLDSYVLSAGSHENWGIFSTQIPHIHGFLSACIVVFSCLFIAFYTPLMGLHQIMSI